MDLMVYSMLSMRFSNCTTSHMKLHLLGSPECENINHFCFVALKHLCSFHVKFNFASIVGTINQNYWIILKCCCYEISKINERISCARRRRPPPKKYLIKLISNSVCSLSLTVHVTRTNVTCGVAPINRIVCTHSHIFTHTHTHLH